MVMTASVPWSSLLARAPLLADGAWGTQLQQLLPPGSCLESLNLALPSAVESVARAYVEAGSDVILTNTFGGSRIALARHGLDARVADINRAGAELSLRAAGHRAVVFGSIGPSSRMLFMDEISAAALDEAFEEQARALAAAGVAALVVETMTDADEAVLAVRAAKRTGLPVIASMVFDAGPARDHTMLGVSVADAVGRLAEAGADAVGANCGEGIAGAAALTARLRACTTLPVWIKPNAGLPEYDDGRIVYRIKASEYAEYTPALIAAGAGFLGGCCGTTPEFIREMRGRLGTGAGWGQ
jgi:5-methyltetrahydrofolate--homocysteine methyltransferase